MGSQVKGWIGAVMLAGLPAASMGQSPATLTVGPGWAVVQDSVVVAFDSKDRTVVWDDIPAEADVSSLQVGGGRYPIRLVSWSRGALDAAVDESQDDDVYTWRPSRPTAGSEPRSVTVRLSSEATGRRTVERAYVTRGLDWRVEYNVLVRGNLTNEQERLSLDLDGVLTVHNTTGRRFVGARLRLVGFEDAPGPLAAGGPGFVMAPDYLLDLLARGHDAGAVTHLYPVPGSADLPEKGGVNLSLVSVQRKPADRLYFMKADEYPASGRADGRPLHRLIVLPNDPDHGMGRPLPSGPARIFLGTFRGTLSREAQFLHTPASGVFRIDLGEAPEVTGSRRFLGRTDSPDIGEYTETYSFLIQNRQNRPVAVEVDDAPAPGLTWTVESASGRWQRRGARIQLNAEAPSRGELELRYTVRVRTPPT